jgi:hypothetical protein
MNIETINLFPLKICKTRCINHEIIKKYMIDNVYDHFCQVGPNDDQLRNYTDYLPGAKFVHWHYLINLYMDCIKRLLTEIGINDINSWSIKVTGWYNVSTHLETPSFHDHTGGPNTIQFSVVHYVCLSEDSKGTVFQNPNIKQIKATVPTKDLKILPSYFLNFHEIPSVKEGDMIIFPSWLDHSFPVHLDGSLRITNALNVMLKIDDKIGF